METILIFGGTGCLGKNLIKKFFKSDKSYRIINYSRDEHKHWQIDQELINSNKNNKNNKTNKNTTLSHVIGDALDSILVKQTIQQYNPTTIYILHALKHVDRCQDNIHACINTNLLSIKNVLDCIHDYVNTNSQSNLKKVLFTSTDKAPSPINVYGMCKGICEELIIEKAKFIQSVKFVIVRYGNVLNSTSSILPSLLQNTSDVYYLTDERMTRFWMTIQQALDTVEYALEFGETGEVIIPQLPAFHIKDLIEYIATLKGKIIQRIGLRPGERLYETLINDTQSIRTIEKNDYYHIIPYFKKPQITEPFVYDSTMNIITDKTILHELLERIINAV